ncbi:MAG: hypothetical protein ACM3NF_02320 [Gemmatimonadota bacterium]
MHLLPLLPVRARALHTDRALCQPYDMAWTARDGAASQVTALAQTTDGYLERRREYA